MLVDDVFEKRPKLSLPDYFPGDEILNPLRRRLTKAEVYVFDRDAVAMTANVALSKPSSVLGALPWIRLPFDNIWIEFANSDLRDSLAALGSPNLQAPNTMAYIERSGFLVRKDGDHALLVDYVHRDRNERFTLTDLSPVQLRFELVGLAPEDFPDLLLEARKRQAETVEAKGKMRQHLRLMNENPEEYAAAFEILRRLDWRPHPDMAAMRSATVRLMGETKAREIEENQAAEATRLFQMFALPALILLNCRNAIGMEEVVPSKSHNRQRRLRGKRPLVVHKLVKVRLSEGQRRQVDRDWQGSRDNFVRGTLVSGHFKVRKTGIFWWSPHARRGWGAVTKRRVVTG